MSKYIDDYGFVAEALRRKREREQDERRAQEKERTIERKKQREQKEIERCTDE